MSPILGSRGISPRGYGFAGASKPNAPVSVSATDVGTSRAYNNGAATVSFTSGGDNGSTITSYTVTSSPGGFTASGASSPLTVTGLQSGVSYTFTATATNSVGTSDASSASSAITATTVPQAPTIGTPTCATGQAYTGSANISVAFTAGATGGKAVSTFTATSSSTGTATNSASPITISQTVGSSYTYTVTATNANGTSLPSSTSASVLSASVPQTPTISSVGINSSTNVTVNWSGATGGSAISSVTVTSSPSISLTYSGTSTAMSVTGSFASNQAYTFTMTTTNAYGTSSTSNGVASTPNPLTPALFVAGGAWTVPAYGTTQATEYMKKNTGKLRYDTETVSVATDNMLRFWSARAAISNYGTSGYILAGWTNSGTSLTENGGGTPTGGTATTLVDKISYTTDSWSSTGATTTISSTVAATALSNGSTAGYVFLNIAGASGQPAPTADANKMTYPTETFSSVRTWTLNTSSATTSPFSYSSLSYTSHSKGNSISNDGTCGYLQTSNYQHTIKWVYSTDNYSTAQATGATSLWQWNFTNKQVAGYLFDINSANTIKKLTFSTDTWSSTGQNISVNRDQLTSGSYSSGGAGYITAGNYSGWITTTEKYTYSTETRSTLSLVFNPTGWKNIGMSSVA